MFHRSNFQQPLKFTFDIHRERSAKMICFHYLVVGPPKERCRLCMQLLFLLDTSLCHPRYIIKICLFLGGSNGCFLSSFNLESMEEMIVNRPYQAQEEVDVLSSPCDTYHVVAETTISLGRTVVPHFVYTKGFAVTCSFRN